MRNADPVYANELEKPGPLVLIVDFAMEPGTGIAPEPICTSRRNAKKFGGLDNRQAAEIAQFDDFRRHTIAAGKFRQSLVERKQIFLRLRGEQFRLLQVPATHTAAVFPTAL